MAAEPESVFPGYADKALKDAGLVIDPRVGGGVMTGFATASCSHSQSARLCDRIWGPRARRRGAEVPQLPGDPALREGTRALVSRRGGDPAASPRVVLEGYMDVVRSHSRHRIRRRDARKLPRHHIRSFCGRPTKSFSASTATRPGARPLAPLEVSLPYLADTRPCDFCFSSEHDRTASCREEGK